MCLFTRRLWNAVIPLVSVFLVISQPVRADDLDQRRVGLQADGRIVVPTNQVLKPAGKQVTFPGRPVDMALCEQGRTLVVKNMQSLVFIDAATGTVKQTLLLSLNPRSKLGFSVVGLVAEGDTIYASDSENHVRVAERQENQSKPLQEDERTLLQDTTLAIFAELKAGRTMAEIEQQSGKM